MPNEFIGSYKYVCGWEWIMQNFRNGSLFLDHCLWLAKKHERNAYNYLSAEIEISRQHYNLQTNKWKIINFVT